MTFLKKDWSYKFEMVYKTFCSVAASKDMKATNKTFCGFLNISTGKLQKWSKGQWPSAEDLETIHDKLGFSYSWLVTGEGDPFEESFIPYPTPDDTAELANLRHEVSDLKEELMHSYREISRLGQELVATNEERRKLAERLERSKVDGSAERDNPGHAASA